MRKGPRAPLFTILYRITRDTRPLICASIARFFFHYIYILIGWIALKNSVALKNV